MPSPASAAFKGPQAAPQRASLLQKALMNLAVSGDQAIDDGKMVNCTRMYFLVLPHHVGHAIDAPVHVRAVL